MLTNQQMISFAQNGFLQVPGAISEELCNYLVDQSWAKLPESWMRDQPATWVGEVTDSCHTSSLLYRRGHIKFQKGFLQTDDKVIGGFGPSSLIGKIANHVLGSAPTVRYRGLYMIVPFADADTLAHYCAPHIEAHPVQIIATTYLSDVEEYGGGLLVWPGSHRDIYPQFQSKLEFIAPKDYKATIGRYRQFKPVELTGKAGDLIILHHRLLHAPSLNRRAKIRFAMFCDYLVADFKNLCQERPGSDPWEDWPGMAKAREEAPASNYTYEIVEPELLLGLSPQPENFSTQNKRDASRLIRSLGVDEVWIVISNRADLVGTNRIEPCGNATGLRVCISGTELASNTANDFVAKLPPNSVGNIDIEGGGERLWLRLVRVSIPVADSKVLLDQELTGEEYRVDGRNIRLVEALAARKCGQK